MQGDSEDAAAASLCDAIYLTTAEDRAQNFALQGFSVEDDSVRHSEGVEDASFKPSYIIAINDESKQLCIVFKGSADIEDWFTNAFFMPVSVDDSVVSSSFKVHAGYWSTLREFTMNELLDKMNSILERRGEISRILITGHSKGGGYATLARTYWVCYKQRINTSHRALEQLYSNVRVVTFGAPLVFSVRDGDYELLQGIPPELHQELCAYVFRNDLVPRLLGNKR